MKKICFYINTLNASGGTQSILTFLVNSLIDNFDVSIIVTDNKEPFYELSPKVEIKRVSVKNKSKFLSILDLNLKLRKIVKNEKYNKIVFLDSNSFLYNSLFIPRKVSVLIWEHFSLPLNSNKLHYKISRLFSVIKCTKFVLICESDLNIWKDKFKFCKHKFSKIYNPSRFDVKSVDFQSNYDFHKVIAIGNKTEVKGFDLLLEAWTLIEKTNWKLEIIGLDTQEINKLKENENYIKRKDTIFLKNRSTNLKEEYEKASIFCLPSRREAFPLVLIESQFFGLPAVTFDISDGVKEIVSEFNSGIIVKHFEVQEYAIQLQKLMNNFVDYIEVAKNTQLNKERFLKENFIKEWKEILKK